MTDTFRAEGTVTIHRIETEIPNLKGEPEGNKKRVLLAVDENQLWQMYIGLERNKLLFPILKKANDKLATEIHKLGEKRYSWNKL